MADPDMTFANVLWRAFGYTLPEPPVVFIRSVKYLMAKEGFSLEWVNKPRKEGLEATE
jgi:hypothetical protein